MTDTRDFGEPVDIPEVAQDVIVFQENGRWFVGYNLPGTTGLGDLV